MVVIPPLPESLERLCTTVYPRFSNDEMRRRRRLVGELLEQAGWGELLVITDTGVERMDRYPRGFEMIEVLAVVGH